MGKNSKGISRRDVLGGAVAGVGALGLSGSLFGRRASAETTSPGGGNDRYNILFVFSDQERYFPSWPAGFALPGHERLRRTGITFHRHYGPACMCTSSRAVLMTGLQTPNNGMFDNTNVPYQPDLSTEFATIGDMLRGVGYYTAYKGKWHLNDDFDTEEPRKLFVEEMEQYGFADYFSPGDIIGHTLGGYENDHMVAGNAIRWLRHRGRPLNDQGQPWALVVGLVNPHDVMYFNTDAAGERIQDDGSLLQRAARAPDHQLYRASWDVALPETLAERFDAPGRPQAHGEFNRLWGHILGDIPMEEVRWRRFNNYYLNCIRHVDLQVARLFGELDALGLADRTIVIYTTDHGELAGSHGVRGKGPFAYEENFHLPFYVVHPDVPGGQDCWALTSHIDVAPTLLALAGAETGRRDEIVSGSLPGKELTTLLQNPGSADVDAARAGVLFVYSCLMTIDAAFFEEIANAKAKGKPPEELIKAGLRPDLGKRGSMRTIFDGRYKFSRYFSPIQRNRPKTLDELYRWNDVELLDLESDPKETRNLAVDREENGELLLAMNAKLDALIEAEIGADDGREMPEVEGMEWSVENIDL